MNGRLLAPHLARRLGGLGEGIVHWYGLILVERGALVSSASLFIFAWEWVLEYCRLDICHDLNVALLGI